MSNNIKNAIKAVIVTAVIIMASSCTKDDTQPFPASPGRPIHKIDTIRTKCSDQADTTKRPRRGINIVKGI